MHLRNKALLGGLAIQTADEDSPWARLLRHRFDRRFTTNLWKGSPNSFALRAGLEVWELGRKWRIGDGSLVNFWDDTWVGTSPLKKILSGPLPQGEQEMKVSTIISNTREWDLNNIPTDIPTHITNKIKGNSVTGLTRSDQDMSIENQMCVQTHWPREADDRLSLSSTTLMFPLF
ncbi:uncharacterized protein LOC116209428 [Punica granatum]|uniref:Uncharacterized protein LOC116209428 n=1 Tax=Punica granatum TaxID=22663 RepID=A0A6P8DSN0_PUNGR|nr:uncharacterized protein LOC116209428 [Punica granatum]